MIKLYYVNRTPQWTGEHEVHAQDCRFLPAPENRIFLGRFDDSRDAVNEARKHFYFVDGCYYCCPESHKR